ncbi:MAG: peptidoglycan-binding protein, partial [Acidimicrobiia bacterium]|nr:peptidoglycan-binding protein [Acidimicrobiia bacterium]
MHHESGNHWLGRSGIGLLLLLAVATAACGGGTGSDAVPSPTSSSTVTTVFPVTTVTTVPPATTTTVPATTTSTVPALPAVALVPGDTGKDVEALQRLLTEHGFLRDAVDGVFGGRTAAAVVAFHKATDAERTSSWLAADWSLLATWEPPELPVREDQPERIEIDLTRQLLYLVGGDGVAVIPVSSGNGEPYANS